MSGSGISQKLEDEERSMLNAARKEPGRFIEGVILSKSEGRQWCQDRGIDASTLVPEVIDKLRRFGEP